MEEAGRQRAVFLAAVGGGRKVSRSVADALRQRGVEPLQPPEAYPSDPNPEKLNADIARSVGGVLVLDKRAMTSPWIKQVAQLLRFRADSDAGFRLVPVITGIQWADLRNSPLGELKLEEFSRVDWDGGERGATAALLDAFDIDRDPAPPEQAQEQPAEEPEQSSADFDAAGSETPETEQTSDPSEGPDPTPRSEPAGPVRWDRPTRRGWVRIAGTVRPLSAPVEALVREVAGVLAEEGCALLTAGAAGVDFVARESFRRSAEARGLPIRIRTYVNELTTRADFKPVDGETLIDREPGASIEEADLVIPFPGGAGTRLAIEQAEKSGLPVFAFPRAGGLAKSAFDEVVAGWDARAIPGLSRIDYGALSVVSAGSIEEFRRLLRRLLDSRDGEAPPEAEAPSPALLADPFTRALLANDLTKGEDLLDITRQARTFAEVIAAREVEAPLAIGLFGEWGSGKSFFMEQVDKELDRLLAEDAARRAAASQIGEPAPDAVYWDQICRIRFNAWHYMDADLWASMAGRIFDGLAEYLHEHAGTQRSPAAERRELRSRLSSAYREREQAQARKDGLEGARDQVRVRVAQLAVEREATLRRVDRLAKEAVRGFLDTDERVRKARMELELAAASAGIEVQADELLHSPDGIERIETVARSGRTLLGRLVPRPRTVGLAVLALALLVPATHLLLSFVGLTFQGATRIWAALTAAVVALGGAGQIAKWLDSMKRISGTAGELRAAMDAVRDQAAVDGLSDLERTERKVLAQREQELAEAERKLAALDEEVHAAEARLIEIDAGRLVYDFVQERAGDDGSYRAHEGIVSLVRRDLETLSGLLRGWKKSEVEAAAKRPEQAPAAAEEGQSADARRKELEALPIQRIVLYIDDLDRCPPAQVVQVLQAVHLLLAFDLFVVMVGVDARWLERSLRIRYGQLVGGDGSSRTLHHSSATPHEYLEKIFQVPYTLPVVEAAGFRRLVTKMLPTGAEGGRTGTEAIDPGEDGRAPDPRGEIEGALARAQSSREVAEDALEDPAPIRTEADGPTLAQQALQEEEQARAALRRLAAAPPQARDFRIEPHEQVFLKGLHAFLTTPRLVKRFVNVYRLLRVQAAREDYSTFAADGPDAHYRVVQTLLAMNIGFPRAGAELLGLLAGDQWAAVAETKTPTWSTFLAAASPTAPSRTSLLRNKLNLDPTDADDRRVQELKSLLPLLAGMTALPEAIEVWRDWAPRVGRYSFYWADT